MVKTKCMSFQRKPIILKYSYQNILKSIRYSDIHASSLIYYITQSKGGAHNCDNSKVVMSLNNILRYYNSCNRTGKILVLSAGDKVTGALIPLCFSAQVIIEGNAKYQLGRGRERIRPTCGPNLWAV